MKNLVGSPSVLNSCTCTPPNNTIIYDKTYKFFVFKELKFTYLLEFF